MKVIVTTITGSTKAVIKKSKLIIFALLPSDSISEKEAYSNENGTEEASISYLTNEIAKELN